MKKQSSIDWLINEMINQMGIRIENTEIGKQLVEQAKEMHKVETIGAFLEGMEVVMFGSIYKKDLKKYYNETFNN